MGNVNRPRLRFGKTERELFMRNDSLDDAFNFVRSVRATVGRVKFL